MDDLWREVESMLLRGSKKPTNWIAKLNQLFAKSRRKFREPDSDLPHIGPATCTIQKEAWSTAAIDAIRTHGTVRNAHDGRAPRVDNLPLVILRFKDLHYLIDGQTRTNKWVASQNDGPHAVILIEHHGT